MNLSNPIKNTNAATLVSGTSADNYIINSVADRNGKVTIDAGAGDDYIADNSRVSSVNAGAGNDTVDHMGQLSTILGGAGNDSIRNSGQTSWIEGGAGRDTIVNTGHQTTVDGGDGNDFIDNTDGRSAGDSSILLGGKGNDTISNGDVGGSRVSIDGGEGNDIIKHNSTSSTINAGVGNNLISLGGAAYDNVIIYGGGNDTIVGFNASNVIDLNNATITNRDTIGSDLKLTTNSGSILLKNASNITPELDNVGGDTSTASTNSVINNTTAGLVITGTPNADTITNSGENVTINALADDDYIVNSSNSVLINSDDGNDSIKADSTSYYNDSLKDVSIIAGAGNDSAFTGTMNNGYIDFGDGNDTLYMSGGKSPTILGGAGKDSIRNDGGFTTYIDGGDDDDYIETGSRKGTVYGGAGNDTIWIGGRAPYTSASGGEGNDSIIVGSNGSTINGGTGNDTVSPYGDTSDFVFEHAAGDGDDVIVNFNSTSKIHITAGKITKTTTEGKDIILTVSDGSKSGTITIKNGANLSGISVMDSLGEMSTVGAALNISNTKGNTLITGTANADSITNKNASNVTINTNDGDDYVYNYTSLTGGGNVTINTGKGNDTIRNVAYDITTNTKGIYLNAGDDEDYVYNQNATAVTIDSGSGNDTIANERGGNASISAGDGDDFISLHGGYNTADGSQGKASNVEGGYVTAIGGAGNDTILNAGSYSAALDGGDGDDLIDSNGANSSLSGGTGADTITNYKEYTTILGGDGNDSIMNTHKAGYSTNGSKSYIDAGDGDDYIYNDSHSKNVTIVGGKGNDTINNYGNDAVIVYNSGDGNDLIENFQAGTTLKIDGAAVTAASVNNSDVILTVGTGTITLSGGKNKELTIIDSNGENSTIISATSTFTTKSTIPTGLSYNSDHSVLTVSDEYVGALEPANYDSVVDTINAGGRTKAIAITGNTNNNSIVGGSKNDTLNGGAGDDTLNGGKGKDKLDGGAGNDVFLSSADDDTLTGGAGNDTFFYANGDGKDVIADFGTGSDIFKITKGEVSKITTSKKNSDVVVTIGKGNVTFKDALTKSITIENADGSLKTIVGGVNVIYNEAEKSELVGLGSADSIYNALGAASVKASSGAGNDTIVNYGYYADIDAGAGNDYVFNEAGYSTIKGGAGNDTVRMTVWNNGSVVDGEAGNDVVILGRYGDGMGNYPAGTNATTEYVSVNGGAGNDSIISYVSYHSTINGGAGNDTIDLSDRANNATTSYKTETLVVRYENGGGKDVITNYAEGLATIAIDNLSDFKKAATGGKKAPNDIVFTIGKGSITIKDGVGKAVSFVDKAGNSITQAYGATTVAVTDSMSDTIDVSKDASVLEVDASNRSKGVTIIGNTKNNTISGSHDNDVLTGGKGKDVFIYSGGNDTITDYTAGQDIIKFSSGTYLVDASLSAVETGADIVFYTNNGNLTIKKAVKLDKKDNYTGNKITVIDGDGDGVNTGAQLYDSSDITVANADGSTIKANLEVINVNASKHSKALYLMGNANNNSLLGGGGADTILALGGDDIMTGGKGKDTFVFSVGEGNDTITDYTVKQDKIQIASGVISTYNVSGKDVIFTVNDSNNTSTNYLTVINGKDKAITVIDSTGKETSETYNDPRELILTKNDSGKFDMNESKYSLIKTVNGTKTTKGVELIANSNGNTLMGGKGKDILTGGLGADTFVYTTGGGNDTITSYVAGEDVIQLGKKTTISKAAVAEVKDADGNVIQANYVFTIGKGKLTVEDGATKPITFVDNDGNRIRYDANYTPTFAVALEERFYDDELDSILTDSKEIAVDYTSTVKDSLSQPTIPLTTNKPDNK